LDVAKRERDQLKPVIMYVLDGDIIVEFSTHQRDRHRTKKKFASRQKKSKSFISFLRSLSIIFLKGGATISKHPFSPKKMTSKKAFAKARSEYLS